MKRSAPLKRAGFKPKVSAQSGILRTATLPDLQKLKKRALKSSFPKSSKIRQSARDKECTLRFPGTCNGRTDTTVLCHSNRLADGKGMGLKVPDTLAAYGCSACHDVLDGRAPRPAGMTYESMNELFDAGVRETQAQVARAGLMEVGNG
jgi:hypothetical protein